jgi:hypothetical protein
MFMYTCHPIRADNVHYITVDLPGHSLSQVQNKIYKKSAQIRPICVIYVLLTHPLSIRNQKKVILLQPEN